MKKIKSEIKIKNDVFKIKIGTIDKKNPEVVYSNIGLYIMPKYEKESYKNNISNIEHSTKSLINKMVTNSEFCKNDFIFVSDIAEGRIALNKKSYFELQLFIKPSDNIRNSCKFSELAKKINDNYIEKIIPNIKHFIEENEFECFFSKK